MKLRSWTRRFGAFAILSLAITGLPMRAGADITGGLQNGYSDNFDYPNATATQDVPLDQSKWQTYPVASDGRPLTRVWTVGSVDSSGNALDTLTRPAGTMKALKQNSTGGGASEPIAFVRGGNWQNLIVQVRAAFVGTSRFSGVGIVFRSPVDPISGLADPNNYYLFTAISKMADQRDCITGRCFLLMKRLGGKFFISGVAHTFLNFIPANGSAPEAHIYKVVMSGSHIMCYVDGQLVIDVNDTSGDDEGPLFGGKQIAMPGPMFANGTVGLRTSNTKAWFDNFSVMGDSPRAYEGRAAAMTTYGQAGSASTGTVVEQTAADTNFQYHDHDFPTGPSGNDTFIAPATPAQGVAGGATVSTEGHRGTVRSTAALIGFSGTLSQAMPDGSTVDVTLQSDSIDAFAQASCTATASSVRLMNLSYQVVVKNRDGIPLVNEGKVTQVNPPPNTVVAGPGNTGGYVRIVLNSQRVTTDPSRADVTAVKIDFLESPLAIGAQGKTFADSGITFASARIGNVVAGRLCTPTI
ncbi:MAG: hypothetical protein NVSMB57_01860 [Actinomycetota bacterium]